MGQERLVLRSAPQVLHKHQRTVGVANGDGATSAPGTSQRDQDRSEVFDFRQVVFLHTQFAGPLQKLPWGELLETIEDVLRLSAMEMGTLKKLIIQCLEESCANCLRGLRPTAAADAAAVAAAAAAAAHEERTALATQSVEGLARPPDSFVELEDGNLQGACFLADGIVTQQKPVHVLHFGLLNPRLAADGHHWRDYLKQSARSDLDDRWGGPGGKTPGGSCTGRGACTAARTTAAKLTRLRGSNAGVPGGH
mmetsp:Transcript_132651/g.335070  ORF Transcript_132651/g.335070 Transcript_132651/m.335070 type:complete len:252 (+) Transcript_132651:756-1511(+)